MPTDLKVLSEKGIDMVQWDTTEDEEWYFETEKKTLPGWGQKDNFISARRQNFALYEADRLADDIQPLADDVRALKLELASMKTQVQSANNGAADIFKPSLVWGLGALVGTMLLGFY